MARQPDALMSIVDHGNAVDECGSAPSDPVAGLRADHAAEPDRDEHVPLAGRRLSDLGRIGEVDVGVHDGIEPGRRLERLVRGV